jgi:hypothetical protein
MAMIFYRLPNSLVSQFKPHFEYERLVRGRSVRVTTTTGRREVATVCLTPSYFFFKILSLCLPRSMCSVKGG